MADEQKFNPLAEDFTESQARCFVADSIRYILHKMYNNITTVGVGTNINFDDISDPELIYFGLATTGFLSMQTFESDTVEDREYDKIIGGTFNLRSLTREETQRIVENYGAKFVDSKKGLKASLCKIQGATYSITSKNGRNTLVLRTPEPELHTPKAEPISTLEFFKLIRNLTAHSIFYRNGDNIVYYTNDGYVSVPTMWMRGYSELFVKEKPAFDANAAREILYNVLPAQNNKLSNEQEINQALSSIKHLFDADTLKHFYRVNNFVNSRIKYQPVFFKVKLSDRVEILLNILEKSPNFLKQANETISPLIIYNLQQLVSKELEKRETKNAIYEGSDLHQEMEALIQEYESLQKRIAFIKGQKKPNIALLQDGIRRSEEIQTKYATIQSKIDAHEKLSSSNMDFYDPEDLQYLPVETAVNIVALLAYTDLVLSSFYEDTLRNTDYTELSNAQKQFFSGFDFNNISYIHKGNKTVVKDPTDVCFTLRAIRNAICHGLISYRFNSLKQGETSSFENVEITFYSDIEDIQVVGSVKSFYELFGPNLFTSERHKSVVTQESGPMRKDVPDIPKVRRFIKSDKIKKKDEEE